MMSLSPTVQIDFAPKIVFADDDITMRLIMVRHLRDWGYDVATFSDGAAAYEYLSNQTSTCLALLDWMMPGMDGIDICQRLQDRSGNAPFIYTILLTAKSGKQNLIKGLTSGAHDFLQKPFDLEELRTRLAVGARIINYENKLAETNAELECYARNMEMLAEERAKQLIQSDRMATLGLMLAGVAHEMGNVLTAVTANAEEMELLWAEIETLLQHEDKDAQDNERLKLLLAEIPDILQSISKSADRVDNIVHGLKNYARRGEAVLGLHSLKTIIGQALDLCRNRFKTRVAVVEEYASNLPNVPCSEQRLLQVIVNLVINGVDALEGTPNAKLWIKADAEGDQARILIEDNGPGFAADTLDKLWEPFFTTKPVGKGTGLGLSICRTIVEEHHGTMLAENREEGGARFMIHLPLFPTPKQE